MWNFFKKFVNKETENIVQTEVSTVIETPIRNYTREEIKDYIKEIRTYSSLRGIVIYIKDYLTKDYSRTDRSVDYDLAKIDLGDIQFYDAFCRNSKIVIDLAVHSFQYYIDICKTLKYLGEKSFSFAVISIHNIDLIACHEITFDFSYIFKDYGNFSNDSVLNFVLNCDLNSGAPKRISSINYDRYDEIALDSIIEKQKNYKIEYEKYIFDSIVSKINEIEESFPEEFFIITISNKEEKEQYFTSALPTQDSTGSYRLCGVLFREGYFALIPAVMYKIQTKKCTRNYIIKQLIDCCNNHPMIIKLRGHFSIIDK